MFDGNWYCLYTKPRQEALSVQSALDEGFEAFCPMIEQRKVRRGKAQIVTAPLFPSYIFVEAEEDKLLKIRHLRGVGRIIGFGKDGSSLLVPGEVLEALSQFLDENNVYKLDRNELKDGDRVKVLDGPLKGIEAIFKKGVKDGERAVILFEMLSTHQEAKVKMEDLIKNED